MLLNKRENIDSIIFGIHFNIILTIYINKCTYKERERDRERNNKIY